MFFKFFDRGLVLHSVDSDSDVQTAYLRGVSIVDEQDTHFSHFLYFCTRTSFMRHAAAMTSILRQSSLNRHQVMAAYCPPTLVYNDIPSGTDCHSSIPYYDDSYTEPGKHKSFSRKSSAQRLCEAVGSGLRACRSKLQLGSQPSTPDKCDDNDGLSIVCAGLDRLSEDDRRRSSGSHYSTSSSSYGPCYSSFSPSSPSSMSQFSRSRSPSDSSQAPSSPSSPVSHQFAFPLVSLSQAANESVISKRPELYESRSIDSLSSCADTQWRSRMGYCEDFAGAPYVVDEEWQYDGLLSLYDPSLPPTTSNDMYYDISSDLLPPLPPAVVSQLSGAHSSESSPQAKPVRKRNVLRRRPRPSRKGGRTLREEYFELEVRV